MAIGSAPEIGRVFIKGQPAHYPWLNADGSLGYLQRGEAKLCFIAGRPGNVYPSHEYTLVQPQAPSQQ